MGHAEILIAGLLVAVAVLSTLGRQVGIPYPIVLVVGGAIFGFIPGVPAITLNPNIVLVVFLPPLLYAAAFFTNLGDIRADVRTVTLNSVGLVLLTMVIVALLAHALIPSMPWGSAFALGAIVSPTDPLAAATIMRRLDFPRWLVSGIEGEGLFNDATSLVAYRVAIAAVVEGSFSLAHASLSFVIDAAAGIAIGLAVGWVVAQIRSRISDAQTSITISLLSGYAAFIPADALGVSGVLAAVTTGLYMGIRGPSIIPPRTRLQGFFVWDVLDFLINAILFVLVGLQLRNVVESLPSKPVGTYAGYAVAISAAVIVSRMLWLFTVPYIIRALDRRPSQRARRIGAGARLVIGWSGMRGAVSLAAALALPLTTNSGAPFPERNLIIFLTFGVIFATLVVQGLTLPALIRKTGITRPQEEENEELRARLVAAKAALAELDALDREDWTREDTIERMRNLYDYRKRRFAARAGKIEDDGYEGRSLAYQQIVQMVLAAQRDALVELRNDGSISNEVMNRVIQELDLASIAAIANVALDVAGQRLVASITVEAVEELGLQEGSRVTAVVKTSDVILAVE